MTSVADVPDYPFEPRSNATLRPGQFWAVPLSDGRSACGRVLAIPPPGDPHLPANTRSFLAGLMDWTGTEPPTSEQLAGSQVIDQGMAHVRTIGETGGMLLGCRNLMLDAITGMRMVSHRMGGTVYLYEGARRLRAATTQEAASLPVLGTWGYRFITTRANYLLSR